MESFIIHFHTPALGLSGVLKKGFLASIMQRPWHLRKEVQD